MQQNARQEDNDEEGLNLFINTSTDINSDNVEFSTVKPRKNKIQTKASINKV